MSLESELVKQINSLQKQVDGLVKPETSIDLISPFLALPGLVGFWPMSSVQRSTGNVYDSSGQGRILTYNGNPIFNYTGLVPYIDLDGTGDYLSRADETDLDITGLEGIFANKGLTTGGWFYPGSLAGFPTFMGKQAGTPNFSWDILEFSGATARISVNGSTLTSVNGGGISTFGWWHLILRFIPSISLDIFVNGVKTSNTTSIPASIFNSTSDFVIGGRSGGNLFTGRASLCFLCANALSDSIISKLFSATRGAFGV